LFLMGGYVWEGGPSWTYPGHGRADGYACVASMANSCSRHSAHSACCALSIAHHVAKRDGAESGCQGPI
jgi:hypothetical protein